MRVLEAYEFYGMELNVPADKPLGGSLESQAAIADQLKEVATELVGTLDSKGGAYWLVKGEDLNGPPELTPARPPEKLHHQCCHHHFIPHHCSC
jgi:hypothetical protein